MKCVLYLIIILLFFSCKSENKSQVQTRSKGTKDTTWHFPVIIDNYQAEAKPANVKFMHQANYIPLYIGVPKDTIKVDYYFTEYGMEFIPDGLSSEDYEAMTNDHPMKKYYIAIKDTVKYKRFNEAKLQIYVGKDVRIKNRSSYIQWENKFVSAVPVWIKNTDKDTVLISYGDYIPLTLLAEDGNEFKPIEKNFVYQGIYGFNYIILPPGEVLIVSVPIYEGEMEVEMRLKLGQHSSQPFTGRINKTQFQSAPQNQ
jgi:hypothetical protein